MLKTVCRRERIHYFFLITAFYLLNLFYLSANAQELETIGLEQVVSAAISNSTELMLVQLDEDISKIEAKQAKSEYYPQIRTQANTEYLNSLENTFSPVAVVDGLVLPANTTFQNSFGLNVTYTLIDFGMRRRKVDLATLDVSSKELLYQHTLRDMTVNIIDRYTEALLCYKEWNVNKDLSKRYREILKLKHALYMGGEGSKVDLSEAAIQMATAIEEEETIRDRFLQALNELTFYTKVTYDESIVIENIDRIELSTLDIPSEGLTLEALIYQLEIDKKQKELEILKRQQWLPILSVYSYYNLYGADRRNYLASLADFKPRNASIGISLVFPVFDGFRHAAEIEKATLQLQKLRVERDHALDEFEHQYRKVRMALESETRQLKNREKVLALQEEKNRLVERLTVEEMIDRSEKLMEEIRLIKESLEIEKARDLQLAALKKLKVYQEGKL